MTTIKVIKLNTRAARRQDPDTNKKTKKGQMTSVCVCTLQGRDTTKPRHVDVRTRLGIICPEISTA